LIVDEVFTTSATQTITGVKTMSGANVITHAPTGLKLQDSNASHVVTIAAGDEAANRTLSIPVLGGADTIATLGTAQTVTGQKTFAAMPIIPVNADVAAAGSVLADAAQLLSGFTVVTGANGTLGVKLPATPAAGTLVIIKGTTAGVLKVWPDAAATINAVGSNGAMSLASGVIPAIFIAKSATQWYTIPLLPS
jgi:hypothetical protein